MAKPTLETLARCGDLPSLPEAERRASISYLLTLALVFLATPSDSEEEDAAERAFELAVGRFRLGAEGAAEFLQFAMDDERLGPVDQNLRRRERPIDLRGHSPEATIAAALEEDGEIEREADRAEFRSFCIALTDAQLREVARDERASSDPRRREHAEIAAGVMRERGILD